MQPAFAFAAPDLRPWQGRLAPVALPARRRTPVGQLVKSMISARTRDAVSIAAYRRLGERFGAAAGIARAEPAEVERLIGDVTFADAKAMRLVAALRLIEASDGGFALAHLATRPLDDALAWLERLPGVARKVSASTLNASTLGRPVMIVDTHVLRVLARAGAVGPVADSRAGSEAVTAAMPDWSGDDFLAFHLQLKRLGQEVCRWDVPRCEACPLADLCATAGKRSGKRDPT
ncbi:endonuclease III domain-containing protein [Sphingomonas bacterium]|uniref:endonuclease III domain-containing protein n=1 Tax=Sphingomonas bacterium TaxID=1895847 RepID=UPI00157673CD|nr:endonuclease [Sphingomonas bacterium]